MSLVYKKVKIKVDNYNKKNYHLSSLNFLMKIRIKCSQHNKRKSIRELIFTFLKRNHYGCFMLLIWKWLSLQENYK